MTHTYTSDIQLLLQFVKDQGFDQPELVEASKRIEYAISNDLTDYCIPLPASNPSETTPNG